MTLIAVTCWGQDRDKAQTLAVGFNHHFAKPVELDRLLELLCSEGLRKLMTGLIPNHSGEFISKLARDCPPLGSFEALLDEDENAS